jgi:uncharacterized protein
MSGNQHGDFIWYELLTSDADAASDFYGKVIGWHSQSSGQPGMDYRFFFAKDGGDPKDGIGGFMAITPEMAEHGARPAWVGYLAVDDVDASAAAIIAGGGSILMPAMDIDGVGRMAMVADPQGAVFYIMHGASDETSYSFAATEPKVGHCAWNALATSAPVAATDFYSAQFGWRKGEEMDMGPMGKYHIMAASENRFMLSGIYPLTAEDPQSHWLFYFRVPNIDNGIVAVNENGGRIHIDPTEIPGGEFSLVAYDPQGAAFGLIGPRP